MNYFIDCEYDWYIRGVYQIWKVWYMKKVIAYMFSKNRVPFTDIGYAVLAPILSLVQLQKMCFQSTIDSAGNQTLTGLQYALKSGNTELIVWPICLFVLSVIGGVAVWFEKPLIVWPVAIAILVIDFLGAWVFGAFPLALLFLISATSLLINKK